MKYIAYTTKGLEEICEKEIVDTVKAQILEKGDKRIVFETDAAFETLTKLRTVDDIGILLGSANDIVLLDKMLQLVNQVNFEEAKERLRSFRQIENQFSITISLARNKALNAQELLAATSKHLAEKYLWEFTKFDHTNFDIRVFIDGKHTYISIRLPKESLHHRAYKTVSKSGSLKPTVAAAMVLLATQRKTGKVVDTFCGSGTILLEALSMGNNIFGGDIDQESVNITKVNLKNLTNTANKNIQISDARRTNWPNHSFDYAISNLPWDKQIQVESITMLYEGAIEEYARILKPDGTLCVLVSKPELFIKYVKKCFKDKKIFQYKIGLLGQNPTIVLVTS